MLLDIQGMHAVFPAMAISFAAYCVAALMAPEAKPRRHPTPTESEQTVVVLRQAAKGSCLGIRPSERSDG